MIKKLFWILLLGFCLLMGIITWPYLDGNYEQGFLLTKLNVLHLSWWRYAFYVHITCSLPVLALGLTQFQRSWLHSKPHLHRNLGKAYLLLVLVLAAPSGLILAIYANGGFWARLSFCLLSLGWWWTTWLAYRFIRQGNIQAHINWMQRSYALTLAAITLRLYVLLLSGIIHLPAKEMYILVSWLSWVPNLLLAEISIRSGWLRFDTTEKANT